MARLVELGLTFSSHCLNRMIDRGFSESDVRTMLEDAIGFQEQDHGTLIVETLRDGEPWEVIVAPDEQLQLIIVITAYPNAQVMTSMNDAYLEVTYRSGHVLAAYYYLPRREGDTSVKVKKHAPGLVVDLTSDGRPIGIEIAIPSLVTVDQINQVLATYGLSSIDAEELAPLRAVA